MPSRMNPNSALFEVALCIMAYCVVLILEYIPAVFEKFADSDKAKSPKLVEFGKHGKKDFLKHFLLCCNRRYSANNAPVIIRYIICINGL